MDKMMKNKKVLVTGGNGYLGRHLAAALEAGGAEVYIMDREPGGAQREYIVDITDAGAVQSAVAEIKPVLVYHLAAMLDRRRDFSGYEQIYRVNVQGTLNLLRALRDVDYENFIFTSTSEVYGDNSAPFTEKQVPDPASPYSLTKLFAENLIRTFGKTYGKKFTLLRLFNFFGKAMPSGFFIPQMIEALKSGKPFEMTGGEQKRDFLYLEDVIRGLILTGENPARNELYNLCSGHAVSLKELVLTVKEQLQSPSEIHFGALPYRENEVWNMWGDNSKIRQHLGFTPRYDLQEAIKEIINY